MVTCYTSSSYYYTEHKGKIYYLLILHDWGNRDADVQNFEYWKRRKLLFGFGDTEFKLIMVLLKVPDFNSTCGIRYREESTLDTKPFIIIGDSYVTVLLGRYMRN